MEYAIQTPPIFTCLRNDDPEGVMRCLGAPPILPAHQAVACFEMALQKPNDALLAALLTAPLDDRFKTTEGSYSLLAKACSIKGMTGGKLQLLVSAGCQHLSEGSSTPLLTVLENHNHEAAQALINAGGYEPGKHDREWRALGRVPPGHPSTEQAKAQIDQFIALGFDVNSVDSQGKSRMMMTALRRNNTDLIAYLVKRGGDPRLVESRDLPDDGAGLPLAMALWEARQLDNEAPESRVVMRSDRRM